MNKIKKLLTKVSDEVKELIRRFPVTMLIVAFLTILFMVIIDQRFSKNTREMIEKLYLFCMIWAFGTIFTETRFVKKTTLTAGYGLTAGISLIFTQMLTSDKMQDSENIGMLIRFLATYLLILTLMSIYQSIRKAEITFQEYILKLFRDLFNMTVTYGILNIGVMLVTAIFVQLILDGEYGSILPRLFILTFGLFYVPSMIYSFSSISQKQINSFIKGLILYLLLPLTTIAMAIIYLYIAKIILLRDMPKNMIYRILAGIFIVAFPVWNMASNYAEDKKFAGKIARRLPYFYAPFILLEIYSIGTRISGFGVTPMRYVSCVFIVFQIIALGLTFYRKGEKLSTICLETAVLLVIVLISPIHYQNVSNWSQKRIFEKKMPVSVNFETLSKEDKNRVKGAYQYLKNAENGEKYIPEYLSEENEKAIKEYAKSYNREEEYPEYISLSCELELNIEKYAQITYTQGKLVSNKNTLVQLENVEKTIDLNDKVQEIMRQNQTETADLDEAFKQNNILKISDTQDLYLSRISFSYYESSGTFNYLHVEGYVLEK